MPKRHLAVLLLLAAACGDSAVATAPEAEAPGATLAAAPPAAGATDTASATPAPKPAATADTSSAQNFPRSIRLEGRALLPSATDSTPAPAAPGTRLTLFRNTLADGKGVSTKVGETTVRADGIFAFADVPGGYLVLAVEVTAAREWGTHVAFLVGNAEVTRVIPRFWPRP
ncbi:hypothetical protein [Roseisolibacter sp. H3M3-2]|uniref:hypothetical protein n=1 Tax=Roseisolibacter sp. H3M3-2 TaxID=3031323 RepID=UPI0023DBFB47|nr:hypothetical protein [Roseisolibacter sp. H3M3-2]MDF1505262.1 hypothetical protein [Roseisolibacter sp. H3M3-2]